MMDDEQRAIALIMGCLMDIDVTLDEDGVTVTLPIEANLYESLDRDALTKIVVEALSEELTESGGDPGQIVVSAEHDAVKLFAPLRSKGGQ